MLKIHKKENKGKQRKTKKNKDRRKTKIGGNENEEQTQIRWNNEIQRINESLADAFKTFSSGPDSYSITGTSHPADG